MKTSHATLYKQWHRPNRCQNGSSNPLTPYREQPRSTRIDVTYPWSAFSATRRTNHAPISFDQQAQAYQGHPSDTNKKKCNTEVHGGGSLELGKPAPLMMPARRFLLTLGGRKQIRGKKSAFLSETSRFAPLILAHKGSALLWPVDDRVSRHPRRMWCLPTR